MSAEYGADRGIVDLLVWLEYLSQGIELFCSMTENLYRSNFGKFNFLMEK